MWRVFLMSAFIVTAAAVRVPVGDASIDDKYNLTTSTESPSTTPEYYVDDPEYYEVDDVSDIDSYLVPPNPHKREKLDPEAPPTYLVPPAPEKQGEFQVATDEGDQSDWRPIPPEIVPLQLPEKIVLLNNDPSSAAPKLPSRELEPPKTKYSEDFVSQDSSEISIKVPSTELETPRVDANSEFDLDSNNVRSAPAEPARTLALQLTPPGRYYPKHPNKMFPKKYITQGFNPIPIPIRQYHPIASGHQEPPKVQRLKLYKPLINPGKIVYIPYGDQKKILDFEHLEHNIQEATAHKEPPEPVEVSDENVNSNQSSAEQQVSETIYRYPVANKYVAKLVKPHARQPAAKIKASTPPPPPPPKERTEFRMHGMKGPHSYQFGYDTGKGKNRQFRFEERDNEGRVRGHYGYMDRSGKLRVFNYNADPDTGFHAEPETDSQPETNSNDST